MPKWNDEQTALQWEYREANTWWRTLSNMRRRDIAFFTAAEAAILTIIGKDLLALSSAYAILSCMGFVIALIGINNERRLYSYIQGFRKRAEEIEENDDGPMFSIHYAREKVKGLQGTTIPSTIAFQIYYTLFALAWVAIWFLNVI